MPPHTCVTSLLLDPRAGRYHVEAVPRGDLRCYDHSPASCREEGKACGEEEARAALEQGQQQQGEIEVEDRGGRMVELLMSQHHLPAVSVCGCLSSCQSMQISILGHAGIAVCISRAVCM